MKLFEIIIAPNSYSDKHDRYYFVATTLVHAVAAIGKKMLGYSGRVVSVTESVSAIGIVKIHKVV